MGTFWGWKTKPNCDKYLQNVQWQFCREKNTAFGNYELRILNVDLSCGITSQFLQRLFFCEGFAKRGEREGSAGISDETFSGSLTFRSCWTQSHSGQPSCKYIFTSWALMITSPDASENAQCFWGPSSTICSKEPNVAHTKPKDNPKMAKYVLIMQNGIL